MRTIVKRGSILGAVLAAWWLGVVAFADYTDPVLNFWIVLGIEAAGMLWILQGTAREGRRYWRQVAAGTGAFAIVAAILFVATYLGWSVLAPDYADVAVARQRALYEASGQVPDDLEARLETLHGMFTPLRQSWFGFVGTLVTGFVFSLLGAIPLREKVAARPKRRTEGRAPAR